MGVVVNYKKEKETTVCCIHWPVTHDLPRGKGNTTDNKKVKGVVGNYRQGKKTRPETPSLSSSFSLISFVYSHGSLLSKKALQEETRENPKSQNQQRPSLFLTFHNLRL